MTRRIIAAIALTLALTGVGGGIASAATYLGTYNGRAVYCYTTPYPINVGTVLRGCGQAYYEWNGPAYLQGGVRWCSRWRTVGAAVVYTWGLTFTPVNTVQLPAVRC